MAHLRASRFFCTKKLGGFWMKLQCALAQNQFYKPNSILKQILNNLS